MTKKESKFTKSAKVEIYIDKRQVPTSETLGVIRDKIVEYYALDSQENIFDICLTGPAGTCTNIAFTIQVEKATTPVLAILEHSVSLLGNIRILTKKTEYKCEI